MGTAVRAAGYVHCPVPVSPAEVAYVLSTAVINGADVSQVVETGPFRLSTAVFSPHYEIPAHYHDWACVSVLVSGRFLQKFPGRACDCPPGVVLTKPAGEKHVDRWFGAWSRHFIIEIDPDRLEALGSCRQVAEEVFHGGGFGAEWLAREAISEIRAPDSATPIALEGLSYQMLARVRRAAGRGPSGRGAPSWLKDVREYLRDNYRLPIRLRDVATAVGVHPDHLSRAFSAANGVTFGSYVRNLRLEAAVGLLIATDLPVSTVAHRCGFADQSHLTRWFRRRFGMAPGRYRAGHRD